MQDTWGIPGPAFIVGYIAALVAIAILAAAHRKVLFRGDRNARVDDLGPQQLAYLNGGDRLAVYSSIGGLRAAGALGTSGSALVQTGPIPAGVTPLDSAIHHAASGQIRTRDLTGDQWVRSALDDLRAGLERRGLAVGPEALKQARLWAWAAGALTLIGVFRLIAGIQNNKPVGFLFAAVVVVAILTWRLARTRRLATGAATARMRQLREQHGYLSPAQSPAYATYGAAGAALGVALFGAAALYDMDPAFAAEAEIQRVVSNGFTSGSSAGSCASSSSCGSSSCGSGSSCGGGSGCGG
jgi:uncharacterized protein (TIGR04222 family)